VPVTLEHLPQNMLINSVKPDHVQATFVGPKRAFYLFDPRKLNITIDGSLLTAGNRQIRISEQNIRFPNEIMLQELTPSTLQVSATRDSAANETKG
jgi:hypothetical protein